MTTDQLRFFISQRPFKPFTIHLADGEIVAVRHPELITPSRSGKTLWLHGRFGDDQVIDLLLVTRLRFMTESELRSPLSR